MNHPVPVLGEDARAAVNDALVPQLYSEWDDGDEVAKATDRVLAALEPVVAALVTEARTEGEQRWKAAYHDKVADFVRETARTSRMLAACDAGAVPRHIVGEALLGWYAAQEHIARAAMDGP